MYSLLYMYMYSFIYFDCSDAFEMLKFVSHANKAYFELNLIERELFIFYSGA